MKIKAFTFAELIVVIAIISIVSVWWAITFFNFIEWREIKAELNKINSIVQNEDAKIDSKEVFDYLIVFSSDKSLYYIYENFFDLDYKALFDIDNSEIKLSKSLEENQEWYSYVFENWKVISKKEDNKENYIIDIKSNAEYRIKNEIIIDNKKLTINDINIYSIQKADKDFKVNNISISEWWTDITNIEIQSIWWKKEFYSNWEIIDSKEIFIYFELDWKQDFIKINK